MFYSGRGGKVYREYRKYRDWLYAIDDKVKEITGSSLFNLFDMSVIRNWYKEGTSSYEVAAWATIRWLYS